MAKVTRDLGRNSTRMPVSADWRDSNGAETKLIDNDPGVNGTDRFNKRSMALSSNTVLRRREPTNPFVASKFTNMVFDHSKQLAVWPDGKPNALIEASQSTGTSSYRTINRSGHPYALMDTFVGGSPDARGNPFGKRRALKDMK